jgi:hypothetical protein
MSESSPAPQQCSPTAKRRNPVERLLVRGFIGVMLVLVAVESNSWWRHKSALDTLRAKIRAFETAADSPAVKEADVKAVVGGMLPVKTEDLKGKGISNGASRLDVYSWFTISPFKKRELYVYYGHQGPADKEGAEVLEVEPDDQVAEPIQVKELTEEEKEQNRKAMMGAGGVGGGVERGGAGAMEQLRKSMMGGAGAAPERAGGERPPARDADKPAGDQPAGDKATGDKAKNPNLNDAEDGKEKQ